MLHFCFFHQHTDNDKHRAHLSIIAHGVQTCLARRLGQIGPEMDIDDVQSLLASERSRFYYVWRDFKNWVASTQPKADHLSLQKLKAKTLHQVAVVERKVIQGAFNTLDEMMTRLLLMPNGVLLEESAARIVVCDEKGFSARSDVLTQNRAVVTRSGRSKAATASAVTSFEHISVCSWLPMRGPALPCGVIVPQKRLHQSFERIWPGALFFANPGGSQTASSFITMLEQCCLRPLRSRWPNREDKCLLLLDTGGGSHLHLTPSVMVLPVLASCHIRFLF